MKKSNKKTYKGSSGKKKSLNLEIIKAAARGEEWAMKNILKYYDAYINRLARRELFDCYGNPIVCMDYAFKEELQSKLLEGVMSFKIRE